MSEDDLWIPLTIVYVFMAVVFAFAFSAERDWKKHPWKNGLAVSAISLGWPVWLALMLAMMFMGL